MSTAIPAIIAWIQKRNAQLATVEWMKWVSENQLELQVGIAAVAILAWLAYAPYKLFRESRADLEKEKSARLVDLRLMAERHASMEKELAEFRERVPDIQVERVWGEIFPDRIQIDVEFINTEARYDEVQCVEDATVTIFPHHIKAAAEMLRESGLLAISVNDTEVEISGERDKHGFSITFVPIADTFPLFSSTIPSPLPERMAAAETIVLNARFLADAATAFEALGVQPGCRAVGSGNEQPLCILGESRSLRVKALVMPMRIDAGSATRLEIKP